MSHFARPHTALGLGTVLSLVLSACAQAPVAPLQPAPLAATAPAPSSRAAAYAGHFESDCQQLGEAFYTRDLVDLVRTPGKDGREDGIEAHYAKAFHDMAGCAASSLVVVFHMPPEQWTFDGSLQMQGRTVDRILTRPHGTGQLTATQARAGWLAETPTQFLLRRNGQGPGLPVDKAVEQVPTKELRLLTSQRLYSSAPSATPDTYPTELDLSSYLQRQPAP